MFATVKACVDGFARKHPQPGLRTERVVGLDATHGLIDGYCYLFFGEDGSPIWVAKAARTEAGRAVFDTEYENLERLEASGMNAERPTVPAPLGRWHDGRTSVTLQTALAGPLMKNVPGSSLFSPAAAGASLERVFDWWLHFQRCLGTRRLRLAGESYAAAVLEPIARFRRRYLLEAEETTFLDRRFEGERALCGIELPLMARHGDFCTANVVLQEGGLGVFDWEFPLEHRLPLFDLFYFFSSLRFPYTGRRGESAHLQSFAAVYWQDSYLRTAVTNLLRRACEPFDPPRAVLGDLFVLSLVHVANMKYEGLLEAHGLPEGDDASDAGKRACWERFDRRDTDEPFASIRDGVFENLRIVVRRGPPEF